MAVMHRRNQNPQLPDNPFSGTSGSGRSLGFSDPRYGAQQVKIQSKSLLAKQACLVVTVVVVLYFAISWSVSPSAPPLPEKRLADSTLPNGRSIDAFGNQMKATGDGENASSNKEKIGGIKTTSAVSSGGIRTSAEWEKSSNEGRSAAGISDAAAKKEQWDVSDAKRSEEDSVDTNRDHFSIENPKTGSDKLALNGDKKDELGEESAEEHGEDGADESTDEKHHEYGELGKPGKKGSEDGTGDKQFKTPKTDKDVSKDKDGESAVDPKPHNEEEGNETTRDALSEGEDAADPKLPNEEEEENETEDKDILEDEGEENENKDKDELEDEDGADPNLRNDEGEENETKDKDEVEDEDGADPKLRNDEGEANETKDKDELEEEDGADPKLRNDEREENETKDKDEVEDKDGADPKLRNDEGEENETKDKDELEDEDGADPKLRNDEGEENETKDKDELEDKDGADPKLRNDEGEENESKDKDELEDKDGADPKLRNDEGEENESKDKDELEDEDGADPKLRNDEGEENETKDKDELEDEDGESVVNSKLRNKGEDNETNVSEDELSAEKRFAPPKLPDDEGENEKTDSGGGSEGGESTAEKPTLYDEQGESKDMDTIPGGGNVTDKPPREIPDDNDDDNLSEEKGLAKGEGRVASPKVSGLGNKDNKPHVEHGNNVEGNQSNFKDNFALPNLSGRRERSNETADGDGLSTGMKGFGRRSNWEEVIDSSAKIGDRLTPPKLPSDGNENRETTFKSGEEIGNFTVGDGSGVNVKTHDEEESGESTAQIHPKFPIDKSNEKNTINKDGDKVDDNNTTTTEDNAHLILPPTAEVQTNVTVTTKDTGNEHQEDLSAGKNVSFVSVGNTNAASINEDYSVMSNKSLSESLAGNVLDALNPKLHAMEEMVGNAKNDTVNVELKESGKGEGVVVPSTLAEKDKKELIDNMTTVNDERNETKREDIQQGSRFEKKGFLRSTLSSSNSTSFSENGAREIQHSSLRKGGSFKSDSSVITSRETQDMDSKTGSKHKRDVEGKSNRKHLSTEKFLLATPTNTTEEAVFPDKSLDTSEVSGTRLENEVSTGSNIAKKRLLPISTLEKKDDKLSSRMSGRSHLKVAAESVETSKKVSSKETGHKNNVRHYHSNYHGRRG